MTFSCKPARLAIYVNTARKTAAQIQQETGCTALINGGLFNMSTFRPVCHLKADGKVLAADQYTYWGYGWDAGGFPALVSDYAALDNYIACVCLVRNAAPEPLYYSAAMGGARPRTAFGTFADGRVWLYADDANLTPEQLQTLAIKAGVRDAIMLDGGGSTQGILPGETVSSTRRVHNFLLVWEDETNGKETDKMSYKVCLDAGHYGKYNQSPVVKNYYESVQMWTLTELLADELEARGVEVVKTRTNQATDLALVTRGKKGKGCDLLISLHSNASSSESTDHPVAIVFRDDSKTLLDEHSESIGLVLAQVVDEVMGTTQKGRTMTRAYNGDRDGNGYKDDEYYGVLHGAKMAGVPGVILEHSFHTNARAATWLLSDTNLRRLAKAEANAIVDWLEDRDGKTTSKPQTTTQTSTVQVETAKLYNKAHARAYTVTANDGLNMRAGAGTNKAILTTLKKGTTFRCYGYYTIQTDGTVWLYGVADGKTGFCSKAYLK